MTKAAPRKARAKPKTADGKNGAEGLKWAVVEAALPHVPFDGFTDKTLEKAGHEAGADSATLQRLFPRGPLSLVEVYSESADAECERRLAKAKLAGMKVRERITLAVRVRVEILEKHKEAARRAAAFLSLPPNAPTAMRLLYHTVDAIWRAVGDTSTDFNFYTKRAILAGVFSTTLMRWFTDTSEDHADTWAFLDHRIEDVMRFEKLKADIRKQASKLPTLTEILRGPARRPAP